MSDIKKIWFIINPKSGGKNKGSLSQKIERFIDSHHFDVKLITTKYAGEATAITRKAVEGKIDIVCAVGGDGTINEIACELINTTTKLAIIPMGSGNGLARHLGLPLSTKKAIQRINQFSSLAVDVGYMNTHFFIGTAGFGFDAHIADLFQKSKKRGFLNYSRLALSEIQSYKEFQVVYQGEEYKNIMMCTFANSSQFGNGLEIAPNAKINDGEMERVFVKKIGLFQFVLFCIRAYLFKSWEDKNIQRKRFTSCTIKANVDQIHVDGEPQKVNYDSIRVKILPKAVQVIV